MFEPLPPTLPVEATALFRTVEVVLGGLVAWVAYVNLRLPLRKSPIFPSEPEPPPSEAAPQGEPEAKPEEAKAEEAEAEAGSEDAPKDDAKAEEAPKDDAKATAEDEPAAPDGDA